MSGPGRFLFLGSIALCMGLNWAALQLVAWAGMTAQNSRTMDWATALDRAVAGQQSCVICRLIDERDVRDAPQGAAMVIQAQEIEGVMDLNTVYMSHVQGQFKSRTNFTRPWGIHAPPLSPPPERAA